MRIIDKKELETPVEKLILKTEDGRYSNDYGMFRSNVHLGTVKSVYNVLQDKTLYEVITKAFANIGLHFNEDAFVYSRHNDKVSILYFKLDDKILKANRILKSNDVIERYITILNSFDGSTSVRFGASNVVLSCSNQFSTTFSNKHSFKHTSNLRTNIDMAVNRLTDVIVREQQLMTIFEKLQSTRLPEKVEQISTLKDGMIYNMLNLDVRYQQMNYVDDKPLSTKMQNRIFDIDTSISTELKQKGYNYWGLFNGITRYYNHVAKSDTFDNTSSKNMHNALKFINNNINGVTPVEVNNKLVFV